MKQFNDITIITADFNERFVDWVSFISTSHNDIENLFDFLMQKDFLQIVQDGKHKGGYMLDSVFANFNVLYLLLNYIMKTDFSDNLALKLAFTHQSSIPKSSLAFNFFLVAAIPL